MSVMEDLMRRMNALEERVSRIESQEHGFITADGGYAIILTAGEDLLRGYVVCILQSGAGMLAFKTPTAGNELDMPLGIVYQSVQLGQQVAVVVAGIAYGMADATTIPYFGYVAYVSSGYAGRLSTAASVGTAQHWRECGHYLESGSIGGLARMVVHFN